MSEEEKIIKRYLDSLEKENERLRAKNMALNDLVNDCKAEIRNLKSLNQ